jgi:hypothetical protein
MNQALKIRQNIARLKSSTYVPDVLRSPEYPFYFNNEIWVKSDSSPETFEKEYYDNPVLHAVINLKASLESNGKIFLKNVKNGELISIDKFRQGATKDETVKKMFRLITNPNPLQSNKEFFALNSIFKDVFGYSFIYANSVNDRIDIKNVELLWNVWPQFMKPELTKKYFEQFEEKGIITKWLWKWGKDEKVFKTDEVLHRKEPNISLKVTEDLVLGQSKQISLQLPLDNIRIAYESRNSIAVNKGMMGIISSNLSDGHLGNQVLEDDEKKEVLEDLSDYGLRHGQKKWLVTRHNIKYQQVDQDVRKLGLLNEIVSDTKIVCHEYGLHHLLLQMEQRGATFENQRVAERSTYQNQTIPEAEDKIEDLNTWLRTRDYGWEYVIDYSHIPALQDDKKSHSETIKNISSAYKELFFAGGCSYNRWLQAMDEEKVNEDWANKRITEMTMDEIQKIKGNFSISNSLDKQNTQ